MWRWDLSCLECILRDVVMDGGTAKALVVSGWREVLMAGGVTEC